MYFLPCQHRVRGKNPQLILGVEEFILLLDTEEFFLHIVVNTEKIKDKFLDEKEEDELRDDSYVLRRIKEPPWLSEFCPPF